MAIKYRIAYAVAVLMMIVMGISSRVFSGQLPFFVSDNAGDVLWASMVYFGFRCLLPNKPLLWSFVGSLVFSFLIEFSQLYQADWINMIRSTTAGALVLGKGFLTVDLIRYTFGITLAWFADRFTQKHLFSRP